MLFKKSLLSLVLLLSLTACSKRVREEVKWLTNDSYIKSSFIDGKIVSRERFKKDDKGVDRLNGYCEYFYVNGNKKAEMYYKMGIWDGHAIKYFENGAIFGRYTRFNGKPFGKQVEYFDNGNVHNIVLSNGRDTTLFQLQLKRNGEVNFIKDLPLYINISKNPIQIGDTMKITATVIEGDGLSTKLILKLINPSNITVLNDTITKYKSIGNNSYYFLYGQFDSVGTYKLQYAVELVNSQGQIIAEGRDTYPITVTDKATIR
jgi:hypothetical protein